MCQQRHQQQQEEVSQSPSRTALDKFKEEFLEPSGPRIHKSVSFNDDLTTYVSVETLENKPQYFYTQEEIETFRAEAYMEKIMKSTGRPAPVHRPLPSLNARQRHHQQQALQPQLSPLKRVMSATGGPRTDVKMNKARNFALAA